MKAVGGILLIVAALLLSVFLERGEKRRVRALVALAELLRVSEEEIGFYGRPLVEIIANFENDDLHIMGFFEKARTGDLYGGLVAVTENSGLLPSEIAPLFSLFREGLPPRAAAAESALRAVREELLRKTELLRSEGKRRVSLFRAVAGAGTAFAVLLLL